MFITFVDVSVLLFNEFRMKTINWAIIMEIFHDNNNQQRILEVRKMSSKTTGFIVKHISWIVNIYEKSKKKNNSSKYSEIQFVSIIMIEKSLCVSVSVSRAYSQIWIETIHYFSSSFKIYIAYEYEYFVQLVFITIYFDRLVWASICIFYLLRLYNHEVFYIIIILNKKNLWSISFYINQ